MRAYLLASAAIVCLVAPAAQAQNLPEAGLPDAGLTGSVGAYTVVKGDTIASIAWQNHVGLVELLSANPAVTSQIISIGQQLTIPGQHLMPDAPRTGIVVNLAEMRLFSFAPDGTVATYPISVGREGWDTPVGQTTIVRMRKDPTWTVPASIRAQNPRLQAVVPAGPDNPLGQYAITLNWPGYLIHGTNTPWSVGKPSSHGCMRLYPEDIEALFGQSKVGEVVTVVDSPFTLGQSNGIIYLQVTPTREQAKQIAGFQPADPLPEDAPAVQQLKARLAGLQGQGIGIDNTAVYQAVARHDGMPVAIGRISQAAQTTPVQQSPIAAAKPEPNWWDQGVATVKGAFGRLTSMALGE